MYLFSYTYVGLNIFTCPNISLAYIAGSGVAGSNNRRVESMYTTANMRKDTFLQILASARQRLSYKIFANLIGKTDECGFLSLLVRFSILFYVNWSSESLWF